MWYDSLREYSGFLSAMIAAVFDTVEEVQQFIDSPQTFNDEYSAWVDAGRPTESDDNWSEFVDTITEDSSESEDSGAA